MHRIICFGEALIDFIEEKASGNTKFFGQYPGGAPANVSVAAAKLGAKASFIGQVGSDDFGDYLIDSLNRYGVCTKNVIQHPSAKTALAFVSLDEHGDRSFEFYRQATADVVFESGQLQHDWFPNNSVFHYCSNTLTDTFISQTSRDALQLARARDCLISFDVNLRDRLWPNREIDKALVVEFAKQSDLLKFERSELDFLSNNEPQMLLDQLFGGGVEAILVTDGGEAVKVLTQENNRFNDAIEIVPPATQVVDTTGGGDAFIGAVLTGLAMQEDPREALSDRSRLSAICKFAVHCGAHAVSSKGVFPSLPTMTDVEPYLDF